MNIKASDFVESPQIHFINYGDIIVLNEKDQFITYKNYDSFLKYFAIPATSRIVIQFDKDCFYPAASFIRELEKLGYKEIAWTDWAIFKIRIIYEKSI